MEVETKNVTVSMDFTARTKQAQQNDRKMMQNQPIIPCCKRKT